MIDLFKNIFGKCKRQYPRITGIVYLSLVFIVASLVILFLFEKIDPLITSVEKITQPKKVLASYQFTPVSANLVEGTEVAITSAAAPITEGINTGSWKGTLADDNFHWVVAGEDPAGVDMQLNIGGVELNGANKMIIQTEIDLDATRLDTLVQICDWVSTTDVDNAVDSQCTGGGWRTLNTKNASQVAVAYSPSDNAADALQWQVYNGYWSTGTTGGTPVNTPLTNFVNGSKQIKIRYYSTVASTAEIAVDFLRVYAIIDPVYFPAEFVQVTGGTVAGHYSSTVMVGNLSTGQQTTAGDDIYLQVPGTAGEPADFYLKFENIKTYTGMNTILVNADSSCSAATAGLQYRYKIRNFQGTVSTDDDTWEDISSTLDCSTTNYFNNFAKNNITIANYINSSNEIWVGVYALSNSTTNLRIDHMYIMLGTTNTDALSCEMSYGTNTAGRIAVNPSAPGSDRIQAMVIDTTYMYIAGYDSSGVDNQWRLEKRNLSDGELVTAFDTDGIVTTDPSTGSDQIFAIATTSGAVFIAGNDLATGAGQWRIEKRDITDGSLITAFDDDGIIQYNPAADIDQALAITVDDSYLYVAGFEDDDTGFWRIHKYDITTGDLVTAFDDDGMVRSTLAAAGDERPQAIRVDANYLYIAGYDNEAGNIQWRLEKRNKTTGALCAGGGECAAGAFDTDGVVQTNPSANSDRIYAMDIDSGYIYVGGIDGVLSAANGQWRVEKRDIATGALVTAFDNDGILQIDPTSADIDWVNDIAVDGTYIYITGFQDDDAGLWYTQKRNKTTGELDVNFSGDGILQSEDGADDRAQDISINNSHAYIAGYGSAPGDNQWVIEKVDISTGIRTDDNFGDNSCLGLRDIDITGGARNAWVIQTEDESANFNRPFYGLDNDGDAVVEEAGAANVGFSVTVPTNTAVSGIYFAGRAMSGPAGTVRLALKDYSGLTGTAGGRAIVGSTISTSMIYTDPLVVAGVGTGGVAGYMTNPEDFIDTVNNAMQLSLITTVAGASTTNSVNVWDFAMVSFSWVEDANHPSSNYQFTPVSANLVEGTEVAITSVLAGALEGVNVGSWKGTLADDNFHWVVAGEDPAGVDMQLNIGGVELNGANKMIIQTEIDLDATRLDTLVQICDWVSTTDVDNAVDSQCTGGGWRTLNTKNASQVAVAYSPSDNAADALQWQVYNGYWSTGTTGGTPVNTPLTNFVNGSKQIKIRYYSTVASTAEIAVDFLRVYAIIDPVYFPAEFIQVTGGTPTGHYSGTVMAGNVVNAQQTTTGDALYLQVPGTAGEISDFYLKFKNVKTYTGMNTILVNADSSCSAATAGLQYRFKIRNFQGTVSTDDDTWEDISTVYDCSTTDYFNNFAKNNITIANYINSSNEIWVGMYALSNSTTKLNVDHMYILLGTTNTDALSCEMSYGTNTAGKLVTNPSYPISDRIEVMKVSAPYMYVGGYDSSGVDNQWRLEKRNLSDGELVTAFDSDGIVTSDPSTGADQITAIASSSDAIFVAGYDSATGSGQWRIEKRNSTDGSLVTAFSDDGIVTYNAAADMDQITSITADDSYIYVTGFEDDDTGVWQIHKYDITDGTLVNAFGTNGTVRSTLAATGDERPQRIKVDANYLYIAGYGNEAGNIEWRMEKRNKTTGSLCAGGGECASGAFDTDGIIQTNPSANTDRIYAMAIDSAYIYLGGLDGSISAANGQWRMEKRDIATGALVNAFDTDGIIQIDPNSADIDWITDMTVDDTYLYATGFQDDDAGVWYTQKRNKTTGALDTNFSSDGIVQSEDGADDRANAIAVNDSNVYIAGYGSASADNQWMIEKLDISTGLRTDDSFGDNTCLGTRDIDSGSGTNNAWAIQTEDESTNFSRAFYGWDTDGDAVVEEAGAVNIGFSVTVPTNAAVSGIYFAGRGINGHLGTSRLALKDYSGLTGTSGGRSIVGATLTTGTAYTDPLSTGGVGSGGVAGYMINPEDYIDTVNNQMQLNLITSVAGASTTNSVNALDFAMVSFSWVETNTSAPAVSIAITSSGVISYGYVDLGNSTSTVGNGYTQVAKNDSAISEIINVKSSNATGGTGWTLAPSAGSDEFKHEFSTTSGATWATMPDSSTYVLAHPLITTNGEINFDFRLTTPVISTDYEQKSMTITVQAVAP
jgi:hypothetical protein